MLSEAMNTKLQTIIGNLKNENERLKAKMEECFEEIRKNPVYSLEWDHLEICAENRLKIGHSESFINFALDADQNERTDKEFIEILSEQIGFLNDSLIDHTPWECNSTSRGTRISAMVKARCLSYWSKELRRIVRYLEK